MNRILSKILDEYPNYCHSVEMFNIGGMEYLVEWAIIAFSDNYYLEEIIDFLETLEVYCLNEENEEEVYNFSFSEFIKKSEND